MVDTLELIQIDTADSIEELCKKEIEYILEYNSYYMNGNGYNMTYGGEGFNGYVFSEEVKEHMSKTRKKYFKDNPEAGKEQSEKMKKRYENPEARKQMSEISKKYFKDNPNARKEHSEKMKKRCENPEVRKHMSEISKKYFKDNPEKITKHGEIFKKYYEDNPEARKEHRKRMKKHYEDNPEARKKHFENNPEAGKEHGERLKKYYEDNPEAGKKNGERLKKSYQKPGFKQKILDLKGKNKPFDVFTTDSKFVKTFTYQFEAAEYLRKEHNITTAIAVSGVLLGKQNSSAGFVFKYK